MAGRGLFSRPVAKIATVPGAKTGMSPGGRPPVPPDVAFRDKSRAATGRGHARQRSLLRLGGGRARQPGLLRPAGGRACQRGLLGLAVEEARYRSVAEHLV